MPPLSRSLSPAPALLALLGLLSSWALLAAAPDPGLVAHWRFSTDRQQGANIKALHGGPDVRPSGPWRLLNEPAPPHLELPGRDERLVLADDFSKTPLPTQDISVEAWVRIDRPQPWGGLLGTLQDNGEFERGWLLGFVNSNFSFALAAGPDPRLTYLQSPTPFLTNHWYHVVGTYDGAELRIYVNGRPENRATHLSGPIAYPPAAPYVVGGYLDADEFYSTAGALHEIRLYRRALAADEIARRYAERQSEFPAPAPPPLPLRLAYGPFAEWIDRTSAHVAWETDAPIPTVVELAGPRGDLRRFESNVATNRHRVVFDALQPDVEYFYRIHAPAREGREVLSPRYLFDTSFYYRPATLPDRARTLAEQDPKDGPRADQILRDSGVSRGWCLVAGAHDGRLALELVRRSDLEVVVIDPDPARIAAVRKLLDEAGVYGVRASAQRVAGPQLPFGDHLANLVVSESALHASRPPAYPAAELRRVTRPNGGVLLLQAAPAPHPDPGALRQAWTDWLAPAELALQPPASGPGIQIVYRLPPLPGTGDWSHQYGNPDNSATSLDERVKGDLQVAWWGDPGPRPMPDRGPRNPSPVSVGGRLFIQGDRVLFGLDAYNGTILWTLSAPEIRRANLPRDCSNMAGLGDTLYLAHGRFCLALDGATGQRLQRFPVPAAPSPDHTADAAPAPAPSDWGYLAVLDSLLVGSRVKRDARYLGDDGEWYEDFHPDQIARVTSESLFGLDRATGDHAWTYRGGAILNSTITIGDGMIFFIESRNPAAISAPGARLSPEILTRQHLVALDLRSGRELWSKPQDFSKCEFMTYLVYSRNTLVVTGTDRDKVYHTSAFHAPSPKNPPGDVDTLATGGQMIWSESHKEDKGHHSGHLQHPVVIDGVFYSDQRSFDLATGKTLRTDLPERRGCGTMSAAKNAIFFRHHFQSMWDLESNKRTQFQGIRSGCWLSLIPASGLLLAPETSAGCSCTHAIQTSVAYLPRSTR